MTKKLMPVPAILRSTSTRERSLPAIPRTSGVRERKHVMPIKGKPRK